MHFLHQEQFSYFVGSGSGMRSECPIVNAWITGAFMFESDAIDFTQKSQDSDGRNFYMVYDENGKTVYVLPPTK